MKNSKQIKKGNSVRKKNIKKISDYYFSNKFSLYGYINLKLAKLVFSYNLNLLKHIFNKNNFIH